MAKPPQLVRSRKSCRTAANDGYPLATDGGRRFKLVTLVERRIADKLLHRVDANKVINIVPVASAFTWRGADAAHHRGERVSIGRPPESVFLPGHALGRLLHAPHDLQPSADIFTRRATPLTRRRTMHVCGTLVRIVFVEDLFFEVVPLMLAISELAESQFLGMFF